MIAVSGLLQALLETSEGGGAKSKKKKSSESSNATNPLHEQLALLMLLRLVKLAAPEYPGDGPSKPAMQKKAKAKVKELTDSTRRDHAQSVLAELLKLSGDSGGTGGHGPSVAAAILAQPGGVAALVDQAAKGGTPIAKTAAVVLLRRVAFSSAEGRAAIGEAGGVPTLVKLLTGSSVAEQRVEAARVLGCLAKGGDGTNAERFTSSGAVPALLKVLSPSAKTTADESLAASAALCAIASSSPNQLKLVAGSHGAGVASLSKHILPCLVASTPAVQAFCAYAGRPPSDGGGVLGAASTTGPEAALASLLSVLSGGSGTAPGFSPPVPVPAKASAPSPPSPEAASAALTVIGSLLPSAPPASLELPDLARLVGYTLSSDASAAVVEHCAAALLVLLPETPSADVVASGALGLCVGVLTHAADAMPDQAATLSAVGGSETLLRHAGEAVLHACGTREGYDEVMRGAGGVLAKVVGSVGVGGPAEQEAMAGLLDLLAGHADGADAISAAGAAVPLVRLAAGQGTASPVASERSVRALCKLAKQAHHARALVAAGAVAPLLTQLKEAESADEMLAAAEAIRRLTASADGRAAVTATAEGLASLVGAVAHGRPDVRKVCLAIVRRLADHQYTRTALAALPASVGACAGAVRTFGGNAAAAALKRRGSSMAASFSPLRAVSRLNLSGNLSLTRQSSRRPSAAGRKRASFADGGGGGAGGGGAGEGDSVGGLEALDHAVATLACLVECGREADVAAAVGCVDGLAAILDRPLPKLPKAPRGAGSGDGLHALRLEAARALAGLSGQRRAHAAILGVLPSLFGLAKGGSELARARAMAALSGLACTGDAKTQAAIAKGAQPMEMLIMQLGGPSPSSKAQTLGVSSLLQLTPYPESFAAVVSGGGLAPLVAIAKEHADAPTRKGAVSYLALLAASSPPNAVAVATTAGAVEALLAALQADVSPAQDRSQRQQISCALEHLVTLTVSRGTILSHGVQACADLVLWKNEAVQLSVLGVLEALCQDAKGLAAVGGSGAASSVVRAAIEAPTSAARASATRILCALTKLPELRHSLLSYGAAHVLVPTLHDGNLAEQKAACTALGLLSKESGGEVAIKAAGGVPVLTDGLTVSKAPLTRMAVLRRLAECADTRAAVAADASAVAACLQLLSGPAEVVHKEHAAAALACLGAAGRRADILTGGIRAADGAGGLVLLLKTKHKGARAQAARALSVLADDNASHSLVGKATSLLVELAKGGGDGAAHASAALRKLSGGGDGDVKAVIGEDTEAARVLVNELVNAPAEAVPPAVYSLLSLSGHPAVRQAIVVGGGVKALVAFGNDQAANEPISADGKIMVRAVASSPPTKGLCSSDHGARNLSPGLPNQPAVSRSLSPHPPIAPSSSHLPPSLSNASTHPSTFEPPAPPNPLPLLISGAHA